MERTRVKFRTVSCRGPKSSPGTVLSIGRRVRSFAPIASSKQLPRSLSQKLFPRTKDVINPDPKAATTPNRPSATMAPSVGQKARQNPSVMARCIVRMLMGPRGSAAAKPTTAEIKKSDGPECDPERKLWANMAHVLTRKELLLHEIYKTFKR